VGYRALRNVRSLAGHTFFNDIDQAKEYVSAFFERLEGIPRRFCELSGAHARRFNTCHTWIGATAVLLIGFRWFHKAPLVTGVRKHIVGYLKGQPEILSKAQERLELHRTRSSQESPDMYRGNNQRPGFTPMNRLNLIYTGCVSTLIHVVGLTANHSGWPGRMGDYLYCCPRVLFRKRSGKHLKSQCQQRVSGQDCQRLPKRAMTGRLAAPDIIVVHGRQVVVDQGVGMHDLKRSRSGQADFFTVAERSQRREHEQGPDAFAAAQHGISHRLGKPSRASRCLQRGIEDLRERLLDARQ
jgi:hypothetical protein